jgi:transcriptional regulator
MYAKVDHAEKDLPTLHKFIHANPLGILTTAIPSSTHPLLQCSHIPWVLDVEGVDNEDQPNLGVLRGHMARANQQAKSMIESAIGDHVLENEKQPTSRSLASEVMILFNGPVQGYVTPKFYIATKSATGKVAPTWNYTAVQVYGRATIYFDSSSAETDEFLSCLLDDLSHHGETEIMKFKKPWAVSDAPGSYLRMQKKAIIGISVQIDRLEGKFKMSQDKPAGDRQGIIQGFERMGTEAALAVADTVRERGALRDAQKERERREQGHR